MKTIKVKSWAEIPIDYTGIVDWSYGTKFWFKDGKAHREDGPAIERSYGTKEWYLEGIEIDETIYIETYIILEITSHPIYPLVKKRKVLLKDEILEDILMPGMKDYELT